MTSYTQVIMEHPGYYWSWYKDTWNLEWMPIQGIYSPPCLQMGISQHKVSVPDFIRPIIGRIIGKEGIHLKWITQRSKTLYIFLKDDAFEIWGTNRNNMYAAHLLNKHILHCINKYNISTN